MRRSVRAIGKRVSSLSQSLHCLSQRYLRNVVWEPFLQQLTDTSVVVLWATHTGESPTVRCWSRAGHTSDAQGFSRPIRALGMRLHRVQIEALQPNTRYHYSIRVDGRRLLPEKQFSFRTAPRTGSNLSFTFIAFGDYGNRTRGQRRLRRQMARDSFDFVLTTGDNSQGHGTYRQLSVTVFQTYRGVFSMGAVFPTLGNHDCKTDDGGPYLDLFDLPRNIWRAEDAGRYYSFDYGNAHFVVLDSNKSLDTTGCAAGGGMLAWLSDDLGKTSQAWKIVTAHHPPFNTGGYGPDERVRTKLAPILEVHGVDLVLSGHQHNYQRTKPLRGGLVTTVEQGGIVYLVSGAGAKAKHPCGHADWLACSICSVDYGIYSRITVNGDTLVIEAIDDQGRVRDRCMLRKPGSGISLGHQREAAILYEGYSRK